MLVLYGDIMNMKGQAALDFLMTYGWALLLVVLVVGALFALGIFDIGSFLGSRSSGFAQIKPVGWKVDSTGAFTIKLQNNAGTDVNITAINATLRTNTLNNGTVTSITNGKQSGTLTVGTFSSPPAAGGSYSVAVSISYTDTATNFAYTDSGTVTGKVS